MDLIVVVEWATVVVTFLMMASGLPACVKMYKGKTTKNVPYFLFLLSALVSILSLQYGLVANNKVLIVINFVAVLVWGAYISVYVLVSENKSSALVKLFSLAALYSAHLYYLQVVPKDRFMPILGLYIQVWCIILYLAPGLDIVTMVKKKSGEGCDVPLLFGGTLSSVTWYLYGVLINDVNIYFPCIFGIIISVTKIVLLVFYGSSSQVPVGPPRMQKPTGGYMSKDFHEEVYKIKSRTDLHKRM